MRFSIFKHSVNKSLGLLGLLSLGFVQAGCAHQVMVEPAVVFNSRLGDASVSVQVGVPGVVVFPPPHVVYSSPQPRVIYAPLGYSVPVYRNPHAWVYAERRNVWGGHPHGGHRHRHWEERNHGRGHDHWDGHNGRNSR
jgi:hypothetical protein